MQIQGKQIQLRDWQLDDIPHYEKWRTGWQEWMNYDAPYYKSDDEKMSEEEKKKLTKRIQEQKFSTPRPQLVIADRHSNVFVGMVSWYWESKETNWLCNGLCIYDPTHWNKGIGYEALGFWNQYLFDAMPKIVRLDLRSWSGNTGMMRLAEKLGYQREATFRNARIIKGKYYDSVGYGILREEWVELYPLGFGAIIK